MFRDTLLARLPALRTGLLSRLVLAFALVVLFVVIANRAAMNGGIILSSQRHQVPASPVSPVRGPAVVRAVPDTRTSTSVTVDRSANLERVGACLARLLVSSTRWSAERWRTRHSAWMR